MTENSSQLEQPLLKKVDRLNLAQKIINQVRKLNLQATKNNETEFGIKEYLESSSGPFIEIAGPTSGGYKFLDMDENHPKLLKSNILPGVSIFNDDTSEFIGYEEGRVDFQADARHLPLASKSASAVFGSCLPEIWDYGEGDVYPKPEIYSEVHRVLKDNGLLILQGSTQPDIDYLSKIGFKVLQNIPKIDSVGAKLNDVVLVKEKKKPLKV